MIRERPGFMGNGNNWIVCLLLVPLGFFGDYGCATHANVIIVWHFVLLVHIFPDLLWNLQLCAYTPLWYMRSDDSKRRKERRKTTVIIHSHAFRLRSKTWSSTLHRLNSKRKAKFKNEREQIDRNELGNLCKSSEIMKKKQWHFSHFFVLNLNLVLEKHRYRCSRRWA